MKGLRLLLAVCLAPLTFCGAMADDNTDAARAAVRRTSNNTVTAQRQKSSESASKESTSNTQSVSRATNLSVKSATGNNERGHTATSTRGGTNTTQTSGNTRAQSVSTRPSAAPQVRTRTASQPVQTRAGTTTQSRSATTRATSTTTPRVVNTARTASTRAALSRSATKTIARAADSDSVAAARTEMMSHNAKKCREVYYSCMDEFCANKDAVLKRCACSNRIHEFDSVKKNLANVEDKMLAFNQRLLTVNMDKEDAEALYKATEGELAFNQKDTSQSKKMLDEIAKKLNTSFNDSNFDRNLSAISLSLNMDAAFDSVDSLQGASATSKSGTELYSAALPVCREMAREVCTDDDLTIAESGYQMVIEQDCNTVAKSYQAQTDQARERVREGSALLDMSRLDIHQKRNSDDTLTCKKKMLDMLTNSSVCGSDMGKCLDVSGKYIDPSTGEAFLTTNLVQINNLITRPTGDQTWTSAPGNSVFVSFLNSKKKFLEPAMENCQDIADTVWNEFLDDALAQIKLAQESKLEDMRQSCTALTTKCLSDTAKSLADFDARALSIFGVKADKTVTAMCADVTNACSALLQNQSGTSSGSDGGDDWIGGMTEIANANTYETILSTCREVGRACIIQVCSSISGNFGLCESIQSSINRKSIINRTACWNEVVNCVKDAGPDKVNDIMAQLGKGITELKQTTITLIPQPSRPTFARASLTPLNPTNPFLPAINLKFYTTENDFYSDIYNTPSKRVDSEPSEPSKPAADKLFIAKQTEAACTVPSTDDLSINPTDTTTGKMTSVNCIHDICDECNFDTDTELTDAEKFNCNACRIAEQIWGNCEAAPTTPLNNDGMHNRILQPKDDKTTLLWWFAQNTGTSTADDSCRDTTCPAGYNIGHNTDQADIWFCTLSDTDPTGTICKYSYEVTTSIKNCCDFEDRDDFDHCPTGSTTLMINFNNTHFNGIKGTTIENKKLYLPTSNTVVATWHLDNATDGYPAGDYALICAGNASTGSGNDEADGYPAGKTITCAGTFVAVNLDTGLYFTPGDPKAETNSVETSNTHGESCHYSLKSDGWKKADDTTQCDITPEKWKINIKY
ncbi:MAG: hypothetical protein K2M34_01885 [Alphaproteobacteria bacterium]|nr:hypothetical protein [Alphaproteobacteria bacterium]